MQKSGALPSRNFAYLTSMPGSHELRLFKSLHTSDRMLVFLRPLIAISRPSPRRVGMTFAMSSSLLLKSYQAEMDHFLKRKLVPTLFTSEGCARLPRRASSPSDQAYCHQRNSLIDCRARSSTSFGSKICHISPCLNRIQVRFGRPIILASTSWQTYKACYLLSPSGMFWN